MKNILLALLIMNMFTATAQPYPRVEIPGSEVRKITSAIVAGQEYEIQILLPAGYEKTNKKYPVVYLMDSQWDFPMLQAIYGEQYYDGFIPELIVAGVTWGGANPKPDSLRARDYSPTHNAGLLQSGGADKFLDFMKTELFPFMEKNYRVNEERSLLGCSFGGLFTLYTLFTHTDMFTGYAAASPYIDWDDEVLYKFEKTFAEKKPGKPVRVYMTVGDVERGRSLFEKLATHLKSRNYQQVSLVTKVLENTGHSGTKGETFTRGLQYIFERNKIQLSPRILTKYAGDYQLSNGTKITLKQDGGSLVLFVSPENKINLFANTETHLYAVHEFFNMYFRENNGQVEGFDLALYGNTLFVKKILN